MATKLTYFFLFLFFFPSFTAVKAQRVDNDTLYSQLHNYALSQNGKWALIRKGYNETFTNDTVYMVNTQDKKIQKEKVTNRIVFLNNSVVCIESAANQVSFLNLNTHKKWTLDHVTNLKLIPHNNLIFYLNAKTHRYCLSQISDDQEVVIWSEHQDQVTYHGFNPTNDVLLVQNPDNLTTIDLKTVEKKTVQQPNITIDRPFWDIKYPKVYLADENKQNNLLYCLDYAKGSLTAVDYSTLQSKPEKILQVESIDEHTALVNYFVIVGEKTYDTTQLELWATNDRYLDRKTRDESPDIQITKSAIFNYNTQELMPLDHLDNREPHVFNEHLILSHNINQYDDYTFHQRFTDLRLYDITTQTTSTLAKHVQNIKMTVSVAPNRAFLVFKEGQTYYLYNTQTNSKTPIIDTASVHDNQYWSKDSQRLYFCTQHGLFVYDLRTQTSKLLLEDKEGALELTLANPTKEEFHSYYLSSKTLIDDTKIVVVAKNKTNNTSTLVRVESQQEKTLLPWTTDRITAVVATDNANTITYSTENYTTPHSIHLWQKNKTRLLVQSDMPKNMYSWRKQKMVEYQDEDGHPLKGLLFYPKDFDPQKKYPMVTKIYQILHANSNQFFFPSMINGDGFNIQVLLENGYFVFLPDILDNDRGTGLSALYCVKQAIATITAAEPSIDATKLGLLGHSHGGYKTNFIITQTDLFKAAVSGAGNSDIVRSYFSYNMNFSTPFYFQFETGQYNMPGPFKDYKQVYLDNSPILDVDQVKTPLLSWTGKHDENIQWEQTKEFFIGLQRNKIPHIALFYKTEGHSLRDTKNCADLTTRIINWFDYFLKGQKNAQWIREGTTFDNKEE